MEPVSNQNRSSSDEPTPAELDAAACLAREPAPLDAQGAEPAPPLAPAVAALVDKHPPPGRAAPPAPAQPSTSATASSHQGFALGIGINFAPPGTAVGFEASLGVVVDLGEPELSLFTSTGSGKSLASGVSAGISGQVSLIGDVTRFWGSGEEVGVNLPRGGSTLNFTTPAPGGAPELNGITVSYGPSLGADGHDFETITQGRSLREIGDAIAQGVHDIEAALKRAAGLPGPRRFGP